MSSSTGKERKKPGPKPKPKDAKGERQGPKIVLSHGTKGDGCEGDGGDGESEWHQGVGQAVKQKQMPMLVSDKYEPTPIPRLREFDPLNMKLDGTVIAIGKRRTGKSFLFRHILHSLKDEFAESRWRPPPF